MIAQYFIMKQVPTIEFISSANKLKEFMPTKSKLSYNDRKKMGVNVMTKILNENIHISNWQTMFKTHKKKDDLADCFLQGYWYIKENKIYIK